MSRLRNSLREASLPVVKSVYSSTQPVMQAQVRHRLEIVVVLLVAPFDPDEQQVNDLTRPAGN
jgi:hypothetical protein